MASPASPNPLADVPSGDADDQDLIRHIREGSRDALELLITRHQAWIYNIVLRMVYNPYDAEDATQEILIKLLTTLSSFEGRSRFLRHVPGTGGPARFTLIGAVGGYRSAADFRVQGQPVDASAGSVVFVNGQAGDLANGRRVRVTGTAVREGVLLADTVQFE